MRLICHAPCDSCSAPLRASLTSLNNGLSGATWGEGLRPLGQRKLVAAVRRCKADGPVKSPPPARLNARQCVIGNHAMPTCDRQTHETGAHLFASARLKLFNKSSKPSPIANWCGSWRSQASMTDNDAIDFLRAVIWPPQSVVILRLVNNAIPTVRAG